MFTGMPGTKLSLPGGTGPGFLPNTAMQGTGSTSSCCCGSTVLCDACAHFGPTSVVPPAVIYLTNSNNSTYFNFPNPIPLYYEPPNLFGLVWGGPPTYCRWLSPCYRGKVNCLGDAECALLYSLGAIPDAYYYTQIELNYQSLADVERPAAGWWLGNAGGLGDFSLGALVPSVVTCNPFAMTFNATMNLLLQPTGCSWLDGGFFFNDVPGGPTDTLTIGTVHT